MKIGHLVKKLPLIIPLMLALTSCSTIGSMQHAPAQPAHPPVIQKHHAVKQHAQISKPHYQVTQMKKHKKQPVFTEPVEQTEAQPAPVMPKPVTTRTEPVKTVEETKAVVITPVAIEKTRHHVIEEFQVTPAVLIDTTSFEMSSPRSYKRIGHRRDVVANLDYLDKNTGQYHYIQVVRWDGRNVTESIINARAAKLEALAGLGVIENSYLDMNFGPTIMLLGGSAYLTNIRGLDYDLILIEGKTPPARDNDNYTMLQDNNSYLSLYAHIEASLQDSRQTSINGICSVNEAENNDGFAIYQLPAYMQTAHMPQEISELSITNLRS